MSEPAVKLAPVLRIWVVSEDTTRRARLAAIAAELGHALASKPDAADAVLADGDCVASDVPVVSLGGQDDEAELRGRKAASPDYFVELSLLDSQPLHDEDGDRIESEQTNPCDYADAR